MILMLTQDLMMSSTVSAAAKESAEPVKTANTVAAAIKSMEENGPRLLLIDLQTPGLQIEQLSACLSGCEADKRPRTVAYAQHVNTQLLETAATVGFDQILTRGQMHNNVSDVLKAGTTSPNNSPA